MQAASETLKHIGPAHILAAVYCEPHLCTLMHSQYPFRNSECQCMRGVMLLDLLLNITLYEQDPAAGSWQNH